MIQRFTDDLLLLDRIALGGMAEVFIGQQSGVGGFQKTVAIKRILPECARLEEFKQMFLRETQLCADLQHPNIVQVFSNGEHEGYLYLVMEFVNGKSLDVIMNAAAEAGLQIQTDTCCHIIAETARGLAYAHSKKNEITGEPLNIVHRDVTPQNVMVSYDGNVKLVDFGIAKAARSTDLTRTGVLKGKEGYLSPEQVAGEDADQQSDIFSLGIVFYELLSGKALFESSSTFATLKKIVQCEIPPLSELEREIDPALERIIRKCLSKNRETRYRTADELLRELTVFRNRAFPEFTSADLAKDIYTLFSEKMEADRLRREKIEGELHVFLEDEARRADTQEPGAQTSSIAVNPELRSGGSRTAMIQPGSMGAGPEGFGRNPSGTFPAQPSSGIYPAPPSGSYPSQQQYGSGAYGAPASGTFAPGTGTAYGQSGSSGGFAAYPPGGSGSFGQLSQSAYQAGQPPRAHVSASRRFGNVLFSVAAAACFTFLLVLAMQYVFPRMFSFSTNEFWHSLSRNGDAVQAGAFAVRVVLAPSLLYACLLLLVAGLPALFLGAALGSIGAMFDLFFNALAYLCLIFLALAGYNFYFAVQQTDVSALWFSLTAVPTVEQMAQISLLSPIVTIVKSSVANIPLKDFLASFSAAPNADMGSIVQSCMNYRVITESFLGLVMVLYLIMLVASVCRRLAFPRRRAAVLAGFFMAGQFLVFSYGVSTADTASRVYGTQAFIMELSLPKSAWIAVALMWISLWLGTFCTQLLTGSTEE